MEVSGDTPPHVLVFPFPAQGHMLPLLDLAAALAANNLTITILTTPGNLPLLSPLLSRFPQIQTLVLPFPSHPSIPPGIENAKDLTPPLLFAMLHALGALHDPLLRWAREAARLPDVMVSDFFLGWTKRVAEEIGIPRVVFCPSGALTLSIGHYLWRKMPGSGAEGEDEVHVVFESIPKQPVFPLNHVSSLYRRYKQGDPASEFIREGNLANTESWGYIFNSFEALEGLYLEHLRMDLGHRRVWAVGPIGGGTPNPTKPINRGGESSISVDVVMNWLDKFKEGSVMYVCFGSQVMLTQPQMDALADALDRSKVHFIWCARLPPTFREGTNDCGVVPNWFEESVVGRGLVIKGWAPQLAILSHQAIGSFLTHCGWNSILEGVLAGVVLLTWPMRADQFINARLLEEMGIGVKVCEGSEYVPNSEKLALIFANSMSNEMEMRKAAMVMQKKALDSVERGGSSYSDMLGFIDEVMKLKQGR